MQDAGQRSLKINPDLGQLTTGHRHWREHNARDERPDGVTGPTPLANSELSAMAATSSRARTWYVSAMPGAAALDRPERSASR